MSTPTIPQPLDPSHRATPLPEHRPPAPRILPAKASFRILVGLMALIPIAVVVAAIVIAI